MATLREPTEEQPEPAAPRGRAPAPLGAPRAPPPPALSVGGATAPDLRVHLGVGTGALTLIFVAQMLGAVVGSWVAGTVRHRLLELSPMAGLAALCVLAAAASPVLGAMAVAMWAAGVFAFVVNASSQ